MEDLHQVEPVGPDLRLTGSTALPTYLRTIRMNHVSTVFSAAPSPQRRARRLRPAALLGVWVMAAVPAAANEPVSFELDVMPILTSRGCNTGACHGKARGQNGFALSLLGFDPNQDFAAITQQARGRRVFPAAPQRSLLLQKATAELPHGGGPRLDREGDDYKTLEHWIQTGLARRIDGEPRLEGIELKQDAVVLEPGQTHQAIVLAHYSDGQKRTVTSRTSFQSNETGLATVDESGLITAGDLPGETAVMVRYMNHIKAIRVTMPMPGEVADQVYEDLPENNFIDPHVWQKLKSLRITPSKLTSDHQFLRRAHVDLIGRLPTANETRACLADADPQKRAKLVDALLDRAEYADHWANKWADLLRPNPYRVGIKAVFNYDNWIRESFRRNQPYDQFVQQLITAQGTTWHNGAVTFFRDRREPDERTAMVSQLFLGIRLECAKCHHHPFEKWGQKDYYQFAAFFSDLGRKGTGLSPPISGSEEMFYSAEKQIRAVKHPLTDETLDAKPLFGELTDDPGADRRTQLARWLTSPENDFFAQVMANRIWADLMGRGLVEPVDDFRATNPPANAPLLKALGNHFRDSGFDIKELLRAIAKSHVYQLNSLPGQRNVGDTRNHSRHYRVRLRAEVLLDAVTDVTGVSSSFAAMPPDARANQIWTHRVGSVFLDTFGRPDPNQDPPCERTTDSSVTQMLHLMNSDELQRRLSSDDGRVAKLAAGEQTPKEIVEELYLAAYSRYPDQEEQSIAQALFDREGTTRRQAAEDLLWALMNTPEFIMKD